MPAFVDVQGMFLPRLRRGTDEQGRPKALQLTGISGVMTSSSAEYFRIALEEKPSDPSILSNYGNWLKERGDLTGADDAYRRAIESNDGFASAHGNLAILLDDRGDLDAAEEEYRRAVELEPQTSIYTVNLGLFLWRRRDLIDEAERLLEEAVAQQRDAFTLGRLAWLTERGVRDHDAAAALYAEALAISPEDRWLNGRFARFLWRVRGDVAAARRHFDQAVVQDEPDHEALLEYAQLEHETGSPAAAVDLSRRATRMRPRDPNSLVMLAAVRTTTGAAAEDDVERMYRQALEWQPDHPVAAINLAQLLLLRGDADDEARRLLLAAADHIGTTQELRMELLFYGFAHRLSGFENAPEEIRSLAVQGVRVVGWDLSRDVAAAERRGHPRADAVAELAASMTGSGP
jgi:Flp pilus assembly protein TadD